MITTEKAQTLAKASDAAYATIEDPRSMNYMENSGYSVVQSDVPLNDPDTGFNLVIYHKDGTDEYIVAFTGTQNPQDAAADIALGKPQWESKGAEVIAYLNELGATAIDFTGHSLGGANIGDVLNY